MDCMADLSAWRGLIVEGSLTGGARNEIYRGQLHGQEVVIHRSTRCEESLRWELDLLKHLHANGCHVPEIVPADDGRRHVNGWRVQEFIHGRHATHDDAAAVRRELARVHQCTADWSQRPDAASARSLLSAPAGTNDVGLEGLPGALAVKVRQAWLAVQPRDRCVIHGDPGGVNALITTKGDCVLIDWDEACVDDPLFDLKLTEGEERAALAWEIVVCWKPEPSYARELAEQMLAGTGSRML